MKKLTAFIITVMLFSESSNAQIVYTDVNPDNTMSCTIPRRQLSRCTKNFPIDLNHDGINDFTLALELAVSYHVGLRNIISINRPSYNEVADTIPQTSSLAKAMIPGANISASTSWFSGVYTLQLIPTVGWGNNIVRYLGVKFKVGSSIHYGWIRASTNSSSTATTVTSAFTIYDYAYNTVPDQPILAGQRSAVLPLHFLSFEGFENDQNTELTWSTTNEINNKGFEVQKSLEGKDFFKIDFVNGKSFTSSVYNYSFTNDHLKSQINYYRLKQIDFDGNFSYSNTIAIKNKSISKSLLTINPNPVANTTIISFLLSQSQNVSLKIFDINGRLVATLVNEELWAGVHEIKWNANNSSGKPLTSGIYLLRIDAEDFKETRKIYVVK